MDFEGTGIFDDAMIRDATPTSWINSDNIKEIPSVETLREIATMARAKRILRAKYHLCARIEQEARMGNFYINLTPSADQTEAAKMLRAKGSQVSINDGCAHRISWAPGL